MWLKSFLTPHYTLPNISGGHDTPHVVRMCAMAPKLASVLTFDSDEFETAVWMHNIDRSKTLRLQVDKAGGFIAYCVRLLAESPFSGEEQNRIAIAVRDHVHKEEEETDSQLLLALKAADKMDRFGPLGILAIAAHRGSILPAYNENRPFGYDTIDEEGLDSLYNDVFRVMTWYRHMHSDAIRELVDKENFRFYVEFARQLGKEIAEITQKPPNEVEYSVQKALGKHYFKFC